MRSELKSYSNLIDNKKGVNNFMSAIDELTLGSNSMYFLFVSFNFLFFINNFK